MIMVTVNTIVSIIMEATVVHAIMDTAWMSMGGTALVHDVNMLQYQVLFFHRY